MSAKIVEKKMRRRARSMKSIREVVGSTMQPLEKRVMFAAFTPGDFVVYRVGDGSAALTTGSTAVFLDEYTPSGHLQQSIALPTAASGLNGALTAAGTAQYEGELSLSQNGQNLLLTGYNSGTGVSSIASSGTVSRVVGVVNSSGGINTTTLLGNAGGGTIYSAASVDGTSGVYASGSKGDYYTTAGSASTATSLTSQSTYDVQVYGNQLYGTPSSGSLGVSTIGSGLQTSSGVTVANITGETFSGTAGAGVGYSREFAFATLNGGSAPDTLYVADAYNDAIDKLSYVSGSWHFTGAIGGYPVTTLAGIEGIVAVPAAGGEQIYFTLSTTTAAGATSTLKSVLDPTGYNSSGGLTAPGQLFSNTPSGIVTLATASGNEAFRGLANVPQPAALSLYSSPSSTTAILGNTATFTSLAYGANATVQWQVNTGSGFTNISNGTNYAGVTATTLQVLNATLAESGYQYQAVFTNASGTVTSSAATLTVIVAPVINNITPNALPTTGGTITITGTNLNAANGATISFNGTAGTIVSDTGTQIVATAPAKTGQVDVTVTTYNSNNGAISSQLSTNDRLYFGTPTITGITNSAGGTITGGVDSGGTVIVLSGTGFTSGDTVTVGGVAATNISYNSSTGKITATVPAEAATNSSTGAPADTAASIIVNNGAGNSSGFSYTYSPTTIAYANTQAINTILNLDSPSLEITSIISSPKFSPLNGRTYSTWAIIATDGTGSVDLYGALPASSSYTPTVGDDIYVTGTWSPYQQIPELETMTAINKISSGNAIPSGIDSIQPLGSSTPVQLTTLPTAAVSTITALNTSTLSTTTTAGYIFTVQGVELSNFKETGATVYTSSFAYNNSLGTMTDESGKSMVVYYYPSSYSLANQNDYGAIPTELVDVTGIVQVTTASPAVIEFTLLGVAPSTLKPTVSGITPPAQGGLTGGETITVKGYGFLDPDTSPATVPTVSFNGVAGSNVTVLSDNLLTVTAPAGGAGTVNITVTDAAGTSAVSASDVYTYTSNPVVSSVSPLGGPTAGGTTVTIMGSNFNASDTVMFGSNAGTGVVFVSSNELMVNAPAEGSGSVAVVVSFPGGGSSSSTLTSADTYIFANNPAITSLTNTSGGTITGGADTGGYSINISGSSFVSGATVSFGGVPATSVTINSSTSLTVGVPQDQGAGTVSLTVTDIFGSASVNFSYSATSIAYAETLTSGTLVSVDTNLVVTSIITQPGVFNGVTYNYYAFLVNDGTGSMDVFSTPPSHPFPQYFNGAGGSLSSAAYVPVVGDMINISGTYAPYQQIPEIEYITAITVLNHGSGTTTVTPLTNQNISSVSLSTLPETVAGYLVTLSNASITYVPPGVSQFGTISFSGNISDGTTTTPLEFYYNPGTYSVANSFFDGLSIPTTPVNITGIMSVYNGTPQLLVLYLGGGNIEQFTQSNNATAAVISNGTNFPYDDYSSVNRGTGITVTVTRSELSGTYNDQGTVVVQVIPDSAVDGQDYNVSIGTLNTATGIVTATLTFGPGVTSESFTINTAATNQINNPAFELLQGDHLFTVAISGASSNASSTVAAAEGAPAGIAILDTNGSFTQSPSSFEENATVTPSGVSHTNGSSGVQVDSATATTILDAGLTGLSIRANNPSNTASYGVLDYNDGSNPFDNQDPADVFNNVGPYGNGWSNGNAIPGNNVIYTINGIEIETTSLPSTYAVSGPLNVYVVSNTSGSIYNTATGSAAAQTGLFGMSPLIFDKANDSTGGLYNQLGSKYLLGQIQYNANQSAGGYSPFVLTNLDPAGIAAIISALNNGNLFRLAVTPANNTATATLVGSTQYAILQSPIIRVSYGNYASYAASQSLSWLSGSTSNYTWDGNNLLVTGAVSITADPETYGNLPLISVLNGGSVNITASSAHIGRLNIASGATVTMAASTGAPSVLVITAPAAGTTQLTINGTLDLKNNFLDVSGGSLTTVDSYILSGAIESSTSSGLITLGAIQDSNGTSQLYGTFGGQTATATDVLIRPTYVGDANIDGKVDGSDYSRIDNGVLHHLTGWFNGDFNYDGVINGSDYTLIDNAFNTEGGALAGPTAQIADEVSTAVPSNFATSSTTDSFFSHKKVKSSLISELDDLVTHA